MPINPNMELIQAVTIGAGGAANIEFTSIPQTYTDLKIVMSLRYAAANNSDDVNISLNGSTANFTGRRLYGSGSAAGSDTNNRSVGITTGSVTTANTFSNCEIYIPNYRSANNKSYSTDQVGENNGTTAYQILTAGLWSDTAAITSITLTPASSSFVQYTTAYLYGVTSAAVGAKATGGIITQDDTYFYHTFLSSGTFTPTQSLTADCLVVAGGGGGGGDIGGGGGAGGYRLLTSQSLNSGTGYTCTIGAGGSAGSAQTRGSNGSTSSFAGSGFSTINTSGGGAGGSAANNANSTGASGGSGGGAAHAGSATFGTGNAGGYSPVEGYNGGGQSSPNNNDFGAGGGGSASVGVTNTTTQTIGSNGGTASTFNSITYAGGGGGGARNSGVAGGLGGGTSTTANKGGGGNGGTFSTNGFAGTANTGGGGGGGGQNSVGGGTGGNGGSGVLIVRYAK